MIQRAHPNDLPGLIEISSRYHAFEELVSTDEDRKRALTPLLQDDSLGCILIHRVGDAITGYIALCFGYSIELGGREAFIDEFFVDQEYRGKGTGDALLAAAITFLSDHGVVALHMEVGRENFAAMKFYSKRGFEARDKYVLMTRSFETRDEAN